MVRYRSRYEPPTPTSNQIARTPVFCPPTINKKTINRLMATRESCLILLVEINWSDKILFKNKTKVNRDRTLVFRHFLNLNVDFFCYILLCYYYQTARARAIGMQAVAAPRLKNWGGGQNEQRRREKHIRGSGACTGRILRCRVLEMTFPAFLGVILHNSED